ncbi:MAG: Rieske 2Fe-2S domain-containing protein [Magnetococcales bacterium]|nr:Rieske 2Fe-2S domain-containing protein [Magnetococcales bacterium]
MKPTPMKPSPLSWSDHPASPSTGEVICAVSGLKEQGGQEFTFHKGEESFSLFVLKHQGHFFAYVNGCKHFVGTPLNPNKTGDFLHPNNPELIRCGVHGALFKIESGECVLGDCEGEFLDPIPLSIVAGNLVVG